MRPTAFEIAAFVAVIIIVILFFVPVRSTQAIVERMAWTRTVQDVHRWTTTDCSNQGDAGKDSRGTPQPTATCQKIDHSVVMGTWTASGSYPQPPADPVTGPIYYSRETSASFFIALKSEKGPLTFTPPFEYLYLTWKPGDRVIAHQSVFGNVTHLSNR